MAGHQYVTVTHSVVVVNSTSTTALAADDNRNYALFINDSDQAFYLKVGAAAVLNQGVRVNPSGGSWEMSPRFGNLDPRAVNVIQVTTTTTKNLLVTAG